MDKTPFNGLSNTLILFDGLSNAEACKLFKAILDRAISIDSNLEQLVNDDELTQRVNDTLYTGQPQDE
jgi:hypothetical protein